MKPTPFLTITAVFILAFHFGERLFAQENKAAGPIIVHEWGTFTCLQDENGNALGGINVDDEPVPYFVYWAGWMRVAHQYSPTIPNVGLPPYSNGKGWIAGDPRVTMRLETPVIYIYPPKGKTPDSVPPLEVQVDFRGGLLTEYYPYASAEWPDARTVSEKTTSNLTWKDIKVRAKGKPVETGEKVWTIPRETAASWLEVKAPRSNEDGTTREESQIERFLFYRGVGHLNSPLKIVQRKRQKTPTKEIFPIETIANFPGADAYPIWCVTIREDGTCFFSKRSSSQGGDLGGESLSKLKASMQDELVKAGLYPDEASAMLRTWEQSYFKSPGVRVFYIVSPKWVDEILPLKVCGAPAKITRVMIGRIELITDAQRAALVRLSAGPCPDLPAFKKSVEKEITHTKMRVKKAEAILRGEAPLSKLGIPVPPLIQDYLSLGRFRDALIVHEQLKRPNPVLEQFIRENRLLLPRQD